MKRTIHVGATERGDVFVTLIWDGSNLAISGVEGPKANGDATGYCGQIEEVLSDLVTWDHQYDKSMTARLAQLWKRWHLNDMKAGCYHQRSAEWDKAPIDPAKPLSAWDYHFEGQRQRTHNMLVWITPEEHPRGLLGKPCPVCGYKYGSAWLREEVPQDVIDWLFSLPEGDKRLPMAWSK